MSPISRLWNTQTAAVVTPEHELEEEEGQGRKVVNKRNKKPAKRIIDFSTIHQVKNDPEEPAEYKIEKQALLEALFGT